MSMKRCIALFAILTLLFTFSMPALAANNRTGSGSCDTAFNSERLFDQEGISQLIRDLLERCKGLVPGTGAAQWPDCPTTPIPPATESPELPESPGTPESTEPPELTDTQAAYAAEVVRLVNEERARLGLGALAVEENLTNAAQQRAIEIKTRFSHTRPDGTSCFTALKEHNVSYRGAGENIASGQRTPEAVMQGWMNSQGHRENILNGSFTKIGVGCYQDADGRYHWTQLFIY